MSETPEKINFGLHLGDFIWSNHVGQRVLVVETGFPKSDTYEYKVVETSPSGLRVKFENSTGRHFWTDHRQYRIVEIL